MLTLMTDSGWLRSMDGNLFHSLDILAVEIEVPGVIVRSVDMVE